MILFTTLIDNVNDSVLHGNVNDSIWIFNKLLNMWINFVELLV